MVRISKIYFIFSLQKMGEFTGIQFVFLTTLEWDCAWQRLQALASSIAGAGGEVFFVENTGFRDFRPSDMGRIFRRLANAVSGRRVGRVHPVPPNLRVISPIVLPPTRGIFRALNAGVFLPLLARRLRRLGLGPRPAAVVYAATATTLELLSILDPSAVVYDVVDHLAAHPGAPADYANSEAALIAEAGLLFTTSPLLQSLHENRHSNVHQIHHGVSEEFFLPPRPGRPRRRLCYFGSLRRDLDYGPFNALAEAGFEVSLIGPERDAPPPLHPSIRRPGLLATGRLVEELRGFDALLLPYARSEWNKGITPAKIFECLATGLPVIASDMPGLAPFSEWLYTARTPEEFVSAAKSLDALESREKELSRVSQARAHSSPRQFALMSEKIREALRPENRPKGGRKPGMLGRIAGGLTVIALFFTLAKAATSLSLILAARFLGPLEYGKANLVLAVCALAQIPFVLGFPLALSHFPSVSDDERSRGGIISGSLLLLLAWTALCAAACAALEPEILSVLGVGPGIWRPAMLLAVLTALHLSASSALQGLHWFRRRGAAEALYGLCSISILAGAYLLGHRSFHSLIYSLAAALAVSSLFSLSSLRRYLVPDWDAPRMKSVIPYAGGGMLAVLAAALTQAPGRLCLFHSRSPEAAGIFSAYFMSTAQIALACAQMVWTVVLPLASLPEGQAQILASARRNWLAICAGGGGLFFLAGAAALRVAGGDYPFHWAWLALFAGAAGAILLHGLFGSLFAARGLRGLFVSASGAVLAGALNLLLNLALVPRWDIAGSAAALLLAYSAASLWYFRKSHEP
jgi:O-antigen/teichoic acid export membrane protein/glycosyltransferase involved in cell wall biosynthesis